MVIDSALNAFSGTNDFSTANLKVPNGSGSPYTPSAAIEIGYDTGQQVFVGRDNSSGGNVTGGFPRVLPVKVPASDFLCGKGGDTSITFPNGITACNNASGTNPTSDTAFTTTFALPATFFQAGKDLRVSAAVGLYSASLPSTLRVSLHLGNTFASSVVVYSSATQTPAVSISDAGIVAVWDVVASGGPSTTAKLFGDTSGLNLPGFNAVQYNHTPEPVTLDTTQTLNVYITVAYASQPGGDGLWLRWMKIEELN